MKKFTIFSVILGVISLLFASYSQGETKSYYSGDALVYQSELYVVTANTGSLELFRLQGKELKRLAKIKPLDPKFGRYGNFYDAHLRQEGTKLFVYTVSDFSLYKYEVSGANLNLVTSLRNSYWEWYNRVDEIDGQLVTISEKSLKVWNDNLQVINEYSFSNSQVPYNVRGNNRFLFNIQNGRLYVYDRESRIVVKEIPLNFRVNPSAHKIYIDANNDVYVVDDYYAKKFNLDGKLLSSFKHLDYEGFDISASGFSQFVYFSNGIGVVKLDKDTMKASDWAWTGGIAGPRGWAMGLESVNLQGDKLVVFNNANILILDDKLNKIASLVAEEQEENIYASENLFLNLDKNSAAANSQVMINGGGFFPNEDLSLDFGGTVFNLKADKRGRFQEILGVPYLEAGAYDIKITGSASQLTYSISFKVE
jgi:hypothetical protein